MKSLDEIIETLADGDIERWQYLHAGEERPGRLVDRSDPRVVLQIVSEETEPTDCVQEAWAQSCSNANAYRREAQLIVCGTVVAVWPLVLVDEFRCLIPTPKLRDTSKVASKPEFQWWMTSWQYEFGALIAAKYTGDRVEYTGYVLDQCGLGIQGWEDYPGDIWSTYSGGKSAKRTILNKQGR